MDNKIERIKQLVQELNNASDVYYNTDKPIMTDKNFDAKFDELKQLETETGFILSNSVTQKVGYEIKSKLEKVTHTTKMLSLDKTKDVNVLKNFLGNKEGILSWKEDGLTIVLTYDDGELVDAVTRGNGEIGSKILSNAMVFKAGIPLRLAYKGHLVVRGEGLIGKEDFDRININDEYANPRNLTSGSIMALDNKIAKGRDLQFKVFSIAECGKMFQLYSEQLIWLKEIGFNPVEYFIVDRTILENEILNFKNDIEKYDFMTDGLVLRFNDIPYGNGLGQTSHHYLHSIAFKWKDSIVESTLRSIQFQVGRTGVLTPVANFDEVEIENSMVSKASLHNISILEALELGVGDSIMIYKANMIIPQIDDNLTRSNTFRLPTECPVCHGEVELRQVNESKSLVCMNPNCSAKLVQKISHAVKRDCLNVDGLSDKLIEKLIDNGFIEDISDLYKLEQYKNTLIHLDGFGLKSYNNLIQSIEKSKHCKLENFIFALGIPNVGKSTSKDLVKFTGCDTPEDALTFISAVPYEYLVKMGDCGDITARSIVTWFKDKDNSRLLSELLKYIEFEEDKQVIQSDNTNLIFAGQKIYCTGSFASHKKEELKAIVESLGGEFTNGYAKSLSMLVVGSLKGSSKEDKARADGVKVIGEDEFLTIIGEL